MHQDGGIMRGSRKFSQAGVGGGGGVQIPRMGLTENFSTWQKLSKDKSMAIPEGVRTPCRTVPRSGFAHGDTQGEFNRQI